MAADKKVVKYIQLLDKKYHFLDRRSEIKYQEHLEENIIDVLRVIQGLIGDRYNPDVKLETEEIQALDDKIQKQLNVLNSYLKATVKKIKIIHEDRALEPEQAKEHIEKRPEGNAYHIEYKRNYNPNTEEVEIDTLIHRVNSEKKVQHINLYGLNEKQFINKARFGIDEEEELHKENLIMYADDILDDEYFDSEESGNEINLSDFITE